MDRRYLYILQLSAVMLMLAAMFLSWHTEHGTGIRLMERALNTFVAFALGNPWEPDYLPLSHWWIVWVIPVLAIALGMRAVIGIIFKVLDGQWKILLGMGFMMTVGAAWYIAAFSAKLLAGFWVEMTGMGFLLSLLLVEISLPAASPIPVDFYGYPPDRQPDLDEPPYYAGGILTGEIMDSEPQGYSPICPACGTLNELGAKSCIACRYELIPESEGNTSRPTNG
jgi:hypothetical protein